VLSLPSFLGERSRSREALVSGDWLTGVFVRLSLSGEVINLKGYSG
jgi:hypothetical protein